MFLSHTHPIAVNYEQLQPTTLELESKILVAS